MNKGLKSFFRLVKLQTARGNLLRGFTVWRYRHLTQQQFLLLCSVAVGILGGLSSVLLKNLTRFFQWVVQSQLVEKYGWSALYFAFPILGIFLTYLVIRYVLRKGVGHGIPEVLSSIAARDSRLPFKTAFSYILTAPLTVGFGGSVGLESPAVTTGASIGSNFARSLHLDSKMRQLLLGCGTAAALSAIFKVPVTGIIFVIEIFALDLTTASLIPLMLSSATGLIISYLFLGQSLSLDYSSLAGFNLKFTPFYLLLAVVAAIVSVHFTNIYSKTGRFFANRLKNQMVRLILGGTLLGALIFIMPSLYGEGYGAINQMLGDNFTDQIRIPFFGLDGNGPVFAALLLLMVYLKMLATSFTFGAGGIGGTFAPTLFMGSALGFSFSKFINSLGNFNLPVSNFTLVGMAGVMAGVMQAPLTAVFLIVETTGGYSLIAPLMIVSAIAYVLTKISVNHNIYTEELLQRGEVPTHDKDKAILSNIRLDKLIETNFIPIHIDDTLGEIAHNAVANSSRNIFPVLGDKKELLGVILLDDLRPVMFDSGLYNKKYAPVLMQDAPEVIIFGRDNVEATMKKFRRSGAWNLPVTSENGRYMGFVSKSKLLSSYRNKMVQLNTESLI